MKLVRNDRRSEAGAAMAMPPAAASDPSQSLLWVGNSFFYYNNGIQAHVRSLAKAAARTLDCTLVAISGAAMDWHQLESYVRPESRLGRHSFVDNNKVRFNPPGPRFDAVILMGSSQCPVHPQLQQTFHETAKQHCATAKRHGLRPYLFMSWAYKDAPQMIDQIAETYTRAAEASHATVIPAGLAFARANRERPELELHDEDLRHPSMAGTYLAACVSYSVITGLSAVGLTYTAGLSAETARFLQAIAWETVVDTPRGRPTQLLAAA